MKIVLAIILTTILLGGLVIYMKGAGSVAGLETETDFSQLDDTISGL